MAVLRRFHREKGHRPTDGWPEVYDASDVSHACAEEQIVPTDVFIVGTFDDGYDQIGEQTLPFGTVVLPAPNGDSRVFFNCFFTKGRPYRGTADFLE